MRSSSPAPPNNPLKRPMFALFAIVGVIVGATGVTYGAWWLVALGAFTAASAVACLRATAGGRNPRWFQSPLDRWWPR